MSHTYQWYEYLELVRSGLPIPSLCYLIVIITGLQFSDCMSISMHKPINSHFKVLVYSVSQRRKLRSETLSASLIYAYS